jgi:DNA-binding NarL/FixJ family response regulator
MRSSAHAARIALLSDQTLFRQGIDELLGKQGFHHVTSYQTSEELFAAERSRRPHIVIVDLDHEREDTTTLVSALRQALPNTHVVLLGTPLRQGAVATTSYGQVETPAADVTRLVASLGTARRPPGPSTELQNQRRLWKQVTPRQREVLRWLATGLDNQSIARRLRIGERAVKAHVSTLLHVLMLKNRTQLALLAAAAGIRARAERAA